MALLNFLKPKNQLEEGGRTSAPVQRDAGEPEKNCPNCHKDIPLSRLWANNLVCPCGYHFRMKARQRIALDKDRMIGAICDNLSQIADDPFATDHLEYYKQHMMGVGEIIAYFENGQKHTAKIEGINDLGELLVIENNEQKCLCSGEITIISIGANSR